MPKKLKTIEVDNEKVYLKKDWLGWRVVEPVILVDEEGKFIKGSWSWKNFLNKKGFISLAYLIFLLFVVYLAFKEQITNYNQVLSNPCAYCNSCQDYARGVISEFNSNQDKINLPEVNISKYMIKNE